MAETELTQGKLYYESHGSGPPLIGLHHGASSSKAWKRQIQDFAKDYTFVVYDRLGHGRSERRLPYDKGYFDNRASELNELVTELGFESVHLCGMCEGGAVALIFASLWPEKVKTLILQGVGYYGDDKTIARCEAYFKPWSELDVAIQRQLVGHHGEDHARLLWRGIREARYYVWSRFYDLRPRFRKIGVPTLIIGGDRDPFFGLEHAITAYNGIEGSELCIIPGAGHFINERSPAVFNGVVLDFLSRRGAWPAGELP